MQIKEQIKDTDALQRVVKARCYNHFFVLLCVGLQTLTPALRIDLSLLNTVNFRVDHYIFNRTVCLMLC